jgi:two-component system, NtrC family, nitrogen regulation response regulator NtrX
VGRSFAIRQVLERVEKVAPTDARVLITGENGTGKELVARAIHRLSPRADEPFIEVNCAAIPSELIESELFGHMKGSFTGATAGPRGEVRARRRRHSLPRRGRRHEPRGAGQGAAGAAGGDHHTGRWARDPGGRAVLAATNKELVQEIREGNFREDLFHRLNVIPSTSRHCASGARTSPCWCSTSPSAPSREAALPLKGFSAEALELLQRMEWSGNVRELRNTVERLLILSNGSTITAKDVELLVAGQVTGGGLSSELLSAETFAEFKEAAERAFILHKLRANDWNVSETARLLDMPRSNLYKKIEKHELVRED